MSLTYDDLFLPFAEAIKPASQFRIGAEAEKFGVLEGGTPIAYEGPNGVLAILQELAERFRWTPSAESPGGPLIALTRDRASITLEPGGQLELSGAPLTNVHEIASETASHLAEVAEVTAKMGIAWLGVGFHPFARQEDLPWVPKARYSVMKVYLPQKGARALDMMRRTSTVQANYDYSSEEDAMRKMRVALKLSPIGTAMFANSPFYEGARSGRRSERAAVWLDVDPDRQGLLPKMWQQGATFRDYVEWALDIPMFLVKRDKRVLHNTGQTFRSFMQDGFEGEKPNRTDWETHINTLFPEVRLKHTIEVRGADSLPQRLAAALPALWTGIFYDDDALAELDELTSDWQFAEVEALRPDVAARALRATFRGRPIAEIAEKVLHAARQGLARRNIRNASGEDERIHLEELCRLVERADSPADALLRSTGDAAHLAPATLIAACKI